MASYDNGAAASNDGKTSEAILDRSWMRSFNGIVKVAEMILDGTVFICAIVWTDAVRKYGGGFVQVVSLVGLILTGLVYVLYIFMIQPKIDKVMPPKWPWDKCETFYALTMTVCFLVCGILSSVYGGNHSSIAACAFFAFCDMAAYGLDAWKCFSRYRNVTPPAASSSSSSPNPA